MPECLSCAKYRSGTGSRVMSMTGVFPASWRPCAGAGRQRARNLQKWFSFSGSTTKPHLVTSHHKGGQSVEAPGHNVHLEDTWSWRGREKTSFWAGSQPECDAGGEDEGQVPGGEVLCKENSPGCADNRDVGTPEVASWGQEKRTQASGLLPFLTVSESSPDDGEKPLWNHLVYRRSSVAGIS